MVTVLVAVVSRGVLLLLDWLALVCLVFLGLPCLVVFSFLMLVVCCLGFRLSGSLGFLCGFDCYLWFCG